MTRKGLKKTTLPSSQQQQHQHHHHHQEIQENQKGVTNPALVGSLSVLTILILLGTALGLYFGLFANSNNNQTEPIPHPLTNSITLPERSIVLYYSTVNGNATALGVSQSATEAACAIAAPRKDCHRTPALMSWGAGQAPTNWPTLYDFPASVQVRGPSGVIATNWTNFMSSTLVNSFVGAGITGLPSNTFWSGIGASGADSGTNCRVWTSNNAGDHGSNGTANTTSTDLWTASLGNFCNVSLPFICACIYVGDLIT